MKLKQYQKDKVGKYLAKARKSMTESEYAETIPLFNFAIPVYTNEDYREAELIARCLGGRIISNLDRYAIIETDNPYYNLCNNLLNEIK